MNRPKEVCIYTVYERLWHWLQTAAILGLLLSGLEIHLPNWIPLAGFATAITLHNVLGFILLGNAFLGLFYHLTTGEIKQYLPEPKDFITLAARQARYYLSGIFRGEQHPFQRNPQRRLNPLQVITYLAILNILLPLQMVTGFLIWGVQHWPGVIDRIGGLRVLASVHSLGAWLFASFIITHIYLTTTGPTLWSHMRAMITGYDRHEEHHESTTKQNDAAAAPAA